MFAYRRRVLSAVVSGMVALTISLCACGGGGGGSQPAGEESEPHTHTEEGTEHTH
jgi:hypothetical protein